jgi:hypothetical protein
MTELRRLPLVAPSMELRGVAPLAFERAAARAEVGTETHRGLLRLGAALARFTLGSCAPPRATAASLEALRACEAWALDDVDDGTVKKARSDAFAALVGLERLTVDAVRSAKLDATRTTPLDPHADAVVLRYAALAAHFAGSTVVLCLDAVTLPREIAAVPQQAAGAFAYRNVGLGPARAPELRSLALEQARWESEREGAPADHGPDALALQIFHEFLGAAWQNQSDAMRAHFFDFVDWALPDELRAS